MELGGEEIVVSGANVTISSDGEGATIDAQQLSRCFILEDGARLELSKIHLRNGFADSSNGGAICVRPGCALRLFSCSVADCEATGDGAADDSYADEAYLADSVTGGGGAVYGFGASVDIHATTVSGCFAASFGAFCSGGVGSTLVLHASVITDCHTTVGDAGALAVTAAGLCLISGCNITCCSAATLCGGFLAVETARLVLSGCAVVEMSASAAAHGGCRDATVVVTHCVFSDGSAYRCLAAGAQHAHASACTLAPSQSPPILPTCVGSFTGMAITSDRIGSWVTVTNTSFARHVSISGTAGGAFGILGSNDEGAVYVADVTITDCDAGYGAGIYQSGLTTEWVRVHISYCTADYGAGLLHLGGDVTIVDLNIDACSAVIDGGGVTPPTSQNVGAKSMMLTKS